MMMTKERVEYRFARRLAGMGASVIREILKVTEQPEVISFAGGLPAPELFPVEELARAHAEVFAEEGAQACQYSTTEGWWPLREWIAGRMRECSGAVTRFARRAAPTIAWSSALA